MTEMRLPRPSIPDMPLDVKRLRLGVGKLGLRPLKVSQEPPPTAYSRVHNYINLRISLKKAQGLKLGNKPRIIVQTEVLRQVGCQ